MEIIDLEKLLKKYMAHIIKTQGDSFVNKFDLEYSEINFKEDENKFLQELETEINHADCICEFETLKSGDLIKVKECNFHKKEI